MSDINTNPQMAGLAGVRMDKDAPESGRARGRKRRKVSYLTLQKIDKVDYKDVATLKRFINDRGKMVSSRQNGNSAAQQRMVSEAIKRAREMALIPFVVSEMPPERREPRRPRIEASALDDAPSNE
jgi:small subunit ribosomal protein S18